MAIIKLENVSKSFQKTTVLQNTDLSLEPGMIYGFVGRNGSGKTVLFKLICGLLKPTTGSITVSGVVLGKDRDFAPNIGLMIETPHFIPYASAMQNLKDLASIRGKIKEEQIRSAIRQVGLDDTDKKRVGKYSLGMRQRLGIAQAIMEDPDLLILDEPMNALDKEGVSDMRALFLELKKAGKTILLASHDAEDIRILCDKVFEMEKGVLRELPEDRSFSV